jgi:hypothetical protein
MDEISRALFSMDMNASPGLDGFVPSFYKQFGPSIKDDVKQLFDRFYDGTLDLDGLNRAHLVLLPKKEGVCAANAFRPISLPNCPMNLFTKTMTNCLHTAIPRIIDVD